MVLEEGQLPTPSVLSLKPMNTDKLLSTKWGILGPSSSGLCTAWQQLYRESAREASFPEIPFPAQSVNWDHLQTKQVLFHCRSGRLRGPLVTGEGGVLVQAAPLKPKLP